MYQLQHEQGQQGLMLLMMEGVEVGRRSNFWGQQQQQQISYKARLVVFSTSTAATVADGAAAGAADVAAGAAAGDTSSASGDDSDVAEFKEEGAALDEEFELSAGVQIMR